MTNDTEKKLLSDQIGEWSPEIMRKMDQLSYENDGLGDVVLGRSLGPGVAVEGVSCKHRWKDVPEGAKDAEGRDIAKGSQHCRLCGSTCLRAPRTGEIVEYDATAGYFGKKNGSSKR
jgi:hypothetical protein